MGREKYWMSKNMGVNYGSENYHVILEISVYLYFLVLKSNGKNLQYPPSGFVFIHSSYWQTKYYILY